MVAERFARAFQVAVGTDGDRLQVLPALGLWDLGVPFRAAPRPGRELFAADGGFLVPLLPGRLVLLRGGEVFDVALSVAVAVSSVYGRLVLLETLFAHPHVGVQKFGGEGAVAVGTRFLCLFTAPYIVLLATPDRQVIFVHLTDGIIQTPGRNISALDNHMVLALSHLFKCGTAHQVVVERSHGEAVATVHAENIGGGHVHRPGTGGI
mmetsp:Transcript_33348/g.65961  ORF Transcript_33348/g.65961 Transcript_33348/m.65961 type:complete len:208 (+) Transcript_33348:501-1124(+)